MKRALVIVAVVAIAITGLPVRTAATPLCHGCCTEIAPCCQMAPASPSTPARTPDAQELRAQLTAGFAQTPSGVMSPGPVSHPRPSDRLARHLQIAFLRI